MRPVKPDSVKSANSSLMSRLMAKPNSVLQDLGEELLCPLRARLPEEIVLRRVFDDLAAVHEDDAVRDLARETHLVGHHHHGHAVPGEPDHDVEDLVDHLGIEGGG